MLLHLSVFSNQFEILYILLKLDQSHQDCPLIIDRRVVLIIVEKEDIVRFLRNKKDLVDDCAAYISYDPLDWIWNDEETVALEHISLKIEVPEGYNCKLSCILASLCTDVIVSAHHDVSVVLVLNAKKFVFLVEQTSGLVEPLVYFAKHASALSL